MEKRNIVKKHIDDKIKNKCKRLLLPCLAGVLVLVLTACGDGEELLSGGQLLEGLLSTESAKDAVGVTPQPLADETERTIYNYEYKYEKGAFGQEDYHTLAGLYAQKGRVREQRNLLEQCYRLFGDQESFELLQNITVNLAEEEGAV